MSVPETAITAINYVYVCTGNGDYGYSDFGIEANYSSLGPGTVNDYNPIHTQGVYRIAHNAASAADYVQLNGTTTAFGTSYNSLLDAFASGGVMRNIIVHPDTSNENILLIATSKGIFRTSNGGYTWQQVLTGASNGVNTILDTEFRGLAYHPVNPNIVYASGKSVYKSTDGGLTWTTIANTHNLPAAFNFIPSRINIAVSAAAPHLLFVYGVKNGYAQLLKYNILNNSWTNYGNYSNYSSAHYNVNYLSVAVSNLDTNYIYISGTRVRGTKTGNNLVLMSVYSNNNFHADVHELVFPPNSHDFLYAATHGGVSKKETAINGSAGWQHLYNGLGVATIWAFDDWEGDDSIMITANQDVGINHSYDKGDNWRSNAPPGDGYGVRVDDQNGITMVVRNAYDGFYDLPDNMTRVYPYPGLSTSDILPLDLPNNSSAKIESAFPLINHPKTEDAYVGLSELYLLKNYALPAGLVDSGIDTIINYINDTIQIKGYRVDNSGNLNTNFYGMHLEPFYQTCAELGGQYIDTVHQFMWQPNFLYSIDTLCYYVDTFITTTPYSNPTVSTDSLRRFLFENHSDLKLTKPSFWHRRIMEMAFSEDEQTDYTYLATLGDDNWRRSDFYVNDATWGCDTCFVCKTDSLPIDSTAQQPGKLDPNPITGIAVDPLDGNRLWLSFSGYAQDIKVWYSEDAGDSWVSYDDSLNSLANLNMPINHIVYQRGTRDRLYIATDVGIYVREGSGNWLRMGDEFPNVRTVELKINYCKGKLRAATFGRGSWECDLLPPEEDFALRSFRTVDSDETWEADKHMKRDIRVKTGVTLTLNNMTLNMAKGGLIVVEPGAALLVNNATITNLCGEVWQGIQVWGQSNKSQTTANQGYLYLNQATVEHARNAISPWQVGNYPDALSTTGGTGGIVEAQNSQFINNWRTADFMRYNSGNKERSYFRECLFSVDEGLRSTTVTDFLGHLSMWGVNALTVQGCTFTDVRSNKSGNAYGIISLGATTHLLATALGNSFPAVNFQRNRFEGLERAVELGGNGFGSYTSVIDQCDFVDNEQGVTIRGQNGVQITRNDFTIGGFDVQGSSGAFVEEYGLGIVSSTSFSAEQNSFVSSNSTDDIIGSWVEDTGSDGKSVRNNSYSDLSAANVAHGYNDDPFVAQDGLQYLCNSNQNNAFDFVVVPNSNSNLADASIGANQGSFAQASRNTFSLPAGSQYQFYNYSYTNGLLNSPLSYYSLSNEAPNPSLLYNVQITNTVNTDPLFCQDNYSNNSSSAISKSSGQLLQVNKLKKRFYRAEVKYQKRTAKYQKLLDKGNADSLRTAIQNTNPQNKNALKDSLMRIAPFLSKETVLTACDCALFNRNQLKKIIKENPDVVQECDFMCCLDACNTALTTADKANILASVPNQLKPNKRTFKRKKMEGKMAAKYLDLFFWADQVIHAYANDSAGPDNDSLEVWIKQKPGLSAQYELAEHYWRQGRFQDALNWIQLIPNTNKMTQKEAENNALYLAFKQLLFRTYQKGRTEANLERLEVDALNEIAAKQVGFASVQAANIVQFFYGKAYPYYPTLPNINNKSARIFNAAEGDTATVAKPSIWAYPNPAINWSDLLYELPEGMKEGTLLITSTAGQTIRSIKLNNQSGIIHLNTSNWSPSIYFAVLYNQDSQSNVFKLVIRK